jgi:hypothetical protein
MVSSLVIAAVIAQAGAATAAPASSQVDFGIRCMVAAQMAVGQLDGAMKASLQLAALYYFGRVDAAAGAELDQRVERVARAMEGQPLGPLLQECGTFMESRGRIMQDVGDRLLAREQARQTQ